MDITEYFAYETRKLVYKEHALYRKMVYQGITPDFTYDNPIGIIPPEIEEAAKVVLDYANKCMTEKAYTHVRNTVSEIIARAVKEEPESEG